MFAPPATRPCRARFASHLTEDDWRFLTGNGRPVAFAAGETMFRQSELGQRIYLVVQGAVAIVKCESNGGQALLTVRGAGDIVGDMAPLDGVHRMATAVALQQVRAVQFNGDDFGRLLRDRNLSDSLRGYTNARLREADELRSEITLLPVRQRLARTLLRLAVEHPAAGHPVIDLGLSQQRLAQLIGASRNSVVSELCALRRAGLLDIARCRIVLRDPAGLLRVGYPPAAAGTG